MGMMGKAALQSFTSDVKFGSRAGFSYPMPYFSTSFPSSGLGTEAPQTLLFQFPGIA